MTAEVLIAVADYGADPDWLVRRCGELPSGWRARLPSGQAAREAYVASRWLLWRSAAELDIPLTAQPLTRHEGPPWWSLSHTEGLAACIWSRHGRCGVDIERAGRPARHAAIARRYFAPAETAWLLSLPPDQQPEAFLGLWTRKEAVIKALGAGIAHHLPHIIFGAEQEAPLAWPRTGQTGELRVQRHRLDHGIVAGAWFGDEPRAALLRLGL